MNKCLKLISNCVNNNTEAIDSTISMLLKKQNVTEVVNPENNIQTLWDKVTSTKSTEFEDLHLVEKEVKIIFEYCKKFEFILTSGTILPLYSLKTLIDSSPKPATLIIAKAK